MAQSQLPTQMITNHGKLTQIVQLKKPKRRWKILALYIITTIKQKTGLRTGWLIKIKKNQNKNKNKSKSQYHLRLQKNLKIVKQTVAAKMTKQQPALKSNKHHTGRMTPLIAKMKKNGNGSKNNRKKKREKRNGKFQQLVVINKMLNIRRNLNSLKELKRLKSGDQILKFIKLNHCSFCP